MKRVLLLGTKSDDVNIFLWCLRQAQYTSIVLGNEQKNKEIKYSPLCKEFINIPPEWSLEEKSIEIINLINSDKHLQVIKKLRSKNKDLVKKYRGQVH